MSLPDDPAAFFSTTPTSPATGGGLPDDPGAFFGAPEVPAGPREREAPSLLEAGARGAKQGLTLGFGDEITGALESAFTSKSYQQARDEARAADKAAHDAHPIGYGLGELLGGVAVPVPGLGVLGTGARLGTRIAINAAKGAGAGILAGAGASEATDVKGVVQDAAKSGLAGAALGGILGTAAESFVKGAPARADEALVSEITGGRATNAGKKVWGDAKDVVAAAREFGIDKAAGDIGEAAARTSTAADKVGSELAAVTKAADAKGGGIPLEAVTKRLERLEEDYRGNAATVDAADAVAKQIEQVKATYGQGGVGGAAGPATLVPADKVREFSSAVGKAGFAGSGLSPGTTAVIKRKSWGAMKDLLNEHVDTVLGPEEGAKFERLNQKYAALMNIAGALKDRANIPPPNRAAGGLRNAGEGLLKAGSIAASVASGNPLPVLATHVGIPLARFGSRQATAALARLSAAAKSGSNVATAIQEALSVGIPRGTVEATVTAFAPKPDDAEAQ